MPDANAAEAVLDAAGLSVKMRGRRANNTGFNYYDTDGRGGVVLLTRATDTEARSDRRRDEDRP